VYNSAGFAQKVVLEGVVRMQVAREILVGLECASDCHQLLENSISVVSALVLRPGWRLRACGDAENLRLVWDVFR
jgi:hypothetical protein